MSIILAFATSKYGIIASDGRFKSGDKIVSENFDKTVQLNNNVICGFAGHSRPCLQALIELQNNPNIQEMCLESIIEILSIRLPKITKSNQLSGFLLIGKNMNNQIQLTGIGTYTKYVPCIEIPTDKEHKFMTISPPGVDSSSIFIKTLQDFQPNIQKGIDMTILRVSQLTEMVNDIRFQKDLFL